MPRLRFLLSVFISLICVLTFAQETTQTPVPASLANPRATLTTFFSAMNETPTDIETAITTMDTSFQPTLVRREFGEKTAIQLFGIFNRTKYINLETVPDNPDLADYTIDLGQGITELRLVKNASGTWQFSPNTLAQVNRIWMEVEHLPVIANMKDLRPAMTLPEQWARNNLSPAWHRTIFLDTEPWKWIGLAIALTVSYLLGLAVRILAKLFIRLKTKQTGKSLSLEALNSLGKGLFLLTTAWTFRRQIDALNVVPTVESGTAFIALVVGTIGIAWFGIGLLELLIAWMSPRMSDTKRAERLVVPIIRNLGRILMVSFALIFFLQRIGFDITGLIAGLGIGGIVIALAAKDSVENIFGSLTVLFEMPFQIGDAIVIDKFEGNVEDISLRSITIRTFYDSVILIPNSKFINTPVENLGRRRYRRLRTIVGLSYTTSVDQLTEFVEEAKKALDNHPGTWKEKNMVALTDFGAANIHVIINAFLEAHEYVQELQLRQEIMLELMKIGERLGIEFVAGVKPNLEPPPGGVVPK